MLRHRRRFSYVLLGRHLRGGFRSPSSMTIRRSSKFLKEEDDRGEARVAAEQDKKADKKFRLPVPKEREISAVPEFWNTNLFPI